MIEDSFNKFLDCYYNWQLKTDLYFNLEKISLYKSPDRRSLAPSTGELRY
jgi:hypothetical protein